MRRVATRRTHPLPAEPPPPRPRGTIGGKVELPANLVLDGRLSATARLVLGSLDALGHTAGPVCWSDDRHLAERHGLSVRSVQQVIHQGERAGWVWRTTPAEYRAWIDRQPWADQVVDLPPAARSARRLIVLLWRLPDVMPEFGELERRAEAAARRQATKRRSAVSCAPEPARSCALEVAVSCAAPVERAENRVPSRARDSALTSSNERDDSLRSSPKPPPTAAEMKRKLLENIAELQRRERAGEIVGGPGYIPKAPPISQGHPRPGAANRINGTRLEEMVAGVLGPDAERALDALILFLSRELHDEKPLTLEFWRHAIRRTLATAHGLDELVRLIMAAPTKPKPACWFSTCLARGRPGAQRLTPGATLESPPRVSDPRSIPPDPSMSNCTRRVNP